MKKVMFLLLALVLDIQLNRRNYMPLRFNALEFHAQHWNRNGFRKAEDSYIPFIINLFSQLAFKIPW